MIARSTRNIVLQFDPAADVLPGGKRLSGGISAAVAIADTLWLTHDETVAIERLSAQERKTVVSAEYAIDRELRRPPYRRPWYAGHLPAARAPHAEGAP